MWATILALMAQAAGATAAPPPPTQADEVALRLVELCRTHSTGKPITREDGRTRKAGLKFDASEAPPWVLADVPGHAGGVIGYALSVEGRVWLRAFPGGGLCSVSVATADDHEASAAWLRERLITAGGWAAGSRTDRPGVTIERMGRAKPAKRPVKLDLAVTTEAEGQAPTRLILLTTHSN